MRLSARQEARPGAEKGVLRYERRRCTSFHAVTLGIAFLVSARSLQLTTLMCMDPTEREIRADGGRTEMAHSPQARVVSELRCRQSERPGLSS